MRKLWHFATQHSPEREGRLLAFASTPDIDDDEAWGKILYPDTEAQEEEKIAKNVAAVQEAIGAALDGRAEREENERQLKTKLDGFGEKISTKIKDGSVGYHDLLDTTTGSLEIPTIIQLFLNEYPSHKTVYEALLLDSGVLKTAFIDKFEAIKKAMQEAQEALIEALKSKLDGFGEKIGTKIKDGSLGYHELLDVAGTTLDRDKLIQLFLNEYLSHKAVYEELLLDKGLLRTAFIDKFDAISEATKTAHEALTETLKTECKEFTKNNPDDSRRSEFAVEAFAATKKDASGANLTKIQDEIRTHHRADFVSAAHGVITDPSKMRGADALKKVNELKEKTDTYLGNLTDIIRIAKGKLKPNKSQDAKDILKALDLKSALLSCRQRNIQDLLERATRIEEWQAGKEKPSEFGTYLTSIARYDVDQTDAGTFFGSKISSTPNAQDAAWELLGEADKMTIANEFQTDDAVAVILRDEIEDIELSVKDYEDELSVLNIDTVCTNVKNGLESLDKKHGKEEEHEEGHEEVHGETASAFVQWYQALNIKFYTPLEVMKGWTMYWETRKSAREESTRRGGSRLAQQFGKAIQRLSPFKEFEREVKQVLDSTVKSEDNKAKSSYIEYLESGPATFQALFNSKDGLLKTQQIDYNRTRAILEYAAKQGWLYEMNAHHHTVMGITLVPGRTLPPNEDPHYYIDNTLAPAQASGESHAKSHGKERVAHDDSIPPIAVILKEELELFNYWAVDGIWEVALGKAKWGHTPEYLHLIVLNHLREHPEARKYMPIKLYDQLKNYGLYGLPGSMIDRGSLSKWQHAYENDTDGANAHLSEAGEFPKAVQKIEEKIIDICHQSHVSTPKRKDMDQFVSKILAGQVVKGDGWNEYLSIYDDDFKDYRQYASGFKGGKIREQDDDFYNPCMGSSMLLMGKAGMTAILDKRSQRDFTIQAKAMDFLAMVITRYDQLKHIADHNPSNKEYAAALKNYADHMRENFDSWIIANMNDASTQPFADFESHSGKINDDGSVKDAFPLTVPENGNKGYAFAEIFKRDMISQKVLESLAADKGKDFAKRVAEHAGKTLTIPKTNGTGGSGAGGATP